MKLLLSRLLPCGGASINGFTQLPVYGAAAERRDYLSPTNLANTLLLYSMFCTTFLKTLDTAPVAGAGFFVHDLFLVTDFLFFNVDKSLHDSFSYVLHRRETFNIRFINSFTLLIKQHSWDPCISIWIPFVPQGTVCHGLFYPPLPWCSADNNI